LEHLLGCSDLTGMKIIVGSESKVKLGAVSKAFSPDGGDDLEIFGRGVESGINSQPIGLAETVRGCRNRLRNLLRLLSEENENEKGNEKETGKEITYCVCIENGLIQLDLGPPPSSYGMARFGLYYYKGLPLR